MVCPAGLSVPESEDEIGIFNNLKIAFQRCAPAVPAVFGKKFRQRNAVGKSVFFCAGVPPFAPPETISVVFSGRYGVRSGTVIPRDPMTATFI